jgi:hypothetical protein
MDLVDNYFRRGVLLTWGHVWRYIAAMNIHDQLVTDIDAFLARHGMFPTEFGVLALSNKHTVRRLREGMGISSHRIARLYEFMADYDRSHGRRGQKKANHSSVAA